jgi:hypothetical protein
MSGLALVLSVQSILMRCMYMPHMSATINNSSDSEIIASPIEVSYSGVGPWIPQTPDSQQGSDLKEQWQDEEEG